MKTAGCCGDFSSQEWQLTCRASVRAAAHGANSLDEIELRRALTGEHAAIARS